MWRGAMVVAHAHSPTHSHRSLAHSLTHSRVAAHCLILTLTLILILSSSSPHPHPHPHYYLTVLCFLILFGLFEGGVVALEVAYHIFMMCLVSAATNLKQLGITPKLLNVVLSHISVTAKDLNGTICHILSHLCAKQLYTVRIKAVAV
mmetsp:Transcript_25197/g.52151  ORF Transcript_25197/g.52151 Transcript_25197/m.52151 type:complete len:148 (-) Transcript_25197:1020-1463(-)